RVRVRVSQNSQNTARSHADRTSVPRSHEQPGNRRFLPQQTTVSKTVSGLWVRRGFKSLPLRLNRLIKRFLSHLCGQARRRMWPIFTTHLTPLRQAGQRLRQSPLPPCPHGAGSVASSPPRDRVVGVNTRGVR